MFENGELTEINFIFEEIKKKKTIYLIKTVSISGV